MALIAFFEHKQIREALEHAAQGGQALHLMEWRGPDLPGVPRCFRGRRYGHLLDQDDNRLTQTAQRFGVRRIKIHKAGTRYQHVDLCGLPLDRAFEEIDWNRVIDTEWLPFPAETRPRPH